MLSISTLIVLIGFRRKATNKLIGSIAVIGVVAITLAEIDSSAMQSVPSWPMFVLLVDILLSCEVPNNYSIAIVSYCCVMLCILTTEKKFRYGLLDFSWGEYSQSKRHKNYSCENLPCELEFNEALTALSAQLGIFVVDFVCTRSFAAALYEEKSAILASIETANHIAISLARFDLESAAELLDESMIPEELREALERILCNLRSYKPYLPQSCLPLDGFEGIIMEDSASLPSRRNKRSASTKSSRNMFDIRRAKTGFKSLTGSLFVANIKSSYSVLLLSAESFRSLIHDLISTTCEVIVRNKGTLDLFLGDRVFANFGATRPLKRHASTCVNAAARIVNLAPAILEPYSEAGNLTLHVGMGSGKLFCGVLGSDSVKRFSVIGKISLLVCVVERTACLAGIPMLSEAGMYNLLKNSFEIRVHLQTILYFNEVHVLYEVMTRDDNEEWMYTCESPDQWETFNNIATALLTDQSTDRCKELNKHSGPHFDRLRSLMKGGPPDPLIIADKCAVSSTQSVTVT